MQDFSYLRVKNKSNEDTLWLQKKQAITNHNKSIAEQNGQEIMVAKKNILKNHNKSIAEENGQEIMVAKIIIMNHKSIVEEN